MKKILVLAAAALTTLAWATSALEVTGVHVAGTQISVTLHNPSSVEESAAFRVTVSEAGGGQETLQSAAVTFVGGSTHTLTATAAHTIVGIIDEPEPINP